MREEVSVSYQNLIVEKSGSRAEVTVNRPQALNALNGQTMEELTAAFRALDADPDVRVVIVTGAGDKAFVAGADISAMADLGVTEARAFARLGYTLGLTLAGMKKIVIAAVHGFALGGGCELALACDFIYASDKAKFGQPEVKLAVIPGFGGTQRLARRVGAARALELVTVGEPISAEEALRIGLCNRVVAGGRDALLEEVRKVAGQIAERGPVAVALAKQAVRESLELSLDAGCRYEGDLFAQCFATADQKEGMRAFLEKRPARFQGR
jgi:enoyl-CoA hydratase